MFPIWKILIVLVIIVVIVGICVLKYFQHKTDFFTITNLDTRKYPVRTLYNRLLALRDVSVVTTGRSVRIAIINNWNAVWSVNDVISAMEQNGVVDRNPSQIYHDIKSVNATTMDTAFDNGSETNLTIPLSNGIQSLVGLNDDAQRLANSIQLSSAIQIIKSILPNATIHIFYYGSNECCTPANPSTNPNIRKTIVQILMNKLLEYESKYDYLCLLDNFLPNENVINQVYRSLQDLKNNKKTILTSCLKQGAPENSFPYGFTNCLNIGGCAIQEGTDYPVAYNFVQGGYSTLFPKPANVSSNLPYYQIGCVSDNDVVMDETKQIVGVPDMSGCSNNLLVYFFGHSFLYRSPNTPALAYSCALAMRDEVTDKKWDYQDIIYRYSRFLFQYIDMGHNSQYSAGNYKLWNPCTGFGILDGLYLSQLLREKDIMNGSPIQLSSESISRDMSYVNFYPISPLEDPLNIIPQHDRYSTLPSFGPSCIWSKLIIRSVDRSNGEINYDPLLEITQNDRVVFLYYSPHEDKVYVLQAFDQNIVRLHLCSVSDLRDSIDESYLWIIQKKNGHAGDIIEYYDSCTIISEKFQNYALSSHYSSNNLSPNDPNYILLSAPSLQYRFSSDANETQFFKLCQHYSEINRFNNVFEEKSYFVNLTNYKEYWSCGVGATAIDDIIKLRLRAANDVEESHPPVIAKREFDPIPQWLLIPMSMSESSNHNLRYGKYMLFNTRLRAYLHISENDLSLTFYHINYHSSPRDHKDIFNYCVFNFNRVASQSPSIAEMFVGHIVENVNELINPLICPLVITFETPYYRKTQDTIRSNKYYTAYITESSNNNVVSFIPAETNFTRAQTFCFLIDPEQLIENNSNITIFTPDTEINRESANERFINHAVSSFYSNSYVQMRRLNEDVSANDYCRWKITIDSRTTFCIKATFHDFEFPIIYNENPTRFTLQNQLYTDQYLISYEGGWKPRLGYIPSNNPDENGKYWWMRPNYLNTLPTSYDDSLSLSANYAYLTLYYIECSKGVMTCSLPEPHLPALLSEITNENVNTTFYSSLFLVV